MPTPLCTSVARRSSLSLQEFVSRIIRRSVTTVPLPGLLHHRTMAALTQEQLADRAGVERLTVSRLERGKRASMTTVRKLADALGVLPVQLMETDK